MLQFLQSVFEKCYSLIKPFQFSRKQFVIFNPWKSSVELNSLLSKFFCYIIWLLYQLIRRDTGRLENEAFTSNPKVSSKQELNGLKITIWKILWNFRAFCHVYNNNDASKCCKFKADVRYFYGNRITQAFPPRWNPPWRGEGAYLTKRFSPSASTSRARRSNATRINRSAYVYAKDLIQSWRI